MEFFPEFQANYKLKYSHLKRVCKYASLIKILDNHYAESAHKLFALSQLGIISSIQEQMTDKEWTTTTNTYTPVTNSQGASRVSSQLGMALSNPATFININMSYPSGKFNWSPDRIPFEHEIDQQINSFFPSKMTSTGMEKNIINLLEELKRKQQTQQDQVSIMVENQNSIFSEIHCCKHLLEEKLDKLEKEHSEFKMNVQKSLEEKDNLIKSFLCNKYHEQGKGYEVKKSSNDDNLNSGYILTNEDNGHVSNTNSTEQSIEVDADDSPAVLINSFVSFANGPNQVPFESISSKSELLFSDLLNDSGPESSLLKILDSSYSSIHQSELSNDSSSNVALSSSLSINSDDIHHEFNVNEYDDSKTCPREASRKAILSTNVDDNERMDLGHGHRQVFLSSSSIFKLGNLILNLPNDDSKVSHAPNDDMLELAAPLFSNDEARSSTLIDAGFDFAPDPLSCLHDNDVVQNESNEQVIASQHKQIVSSAFPFEELNKTISESLEIEYYKTNNDQNEQLPVFNDFLDVNEQLTILPTNSNERRSSSPIAADPHSSDIPDGFNDDDMPSTSIKPRTDSQHCQTILALSPIKESITSPTGGTASSVLNYQEPLSNIDDSIVKLNDDANEHQASNKNRLSSNQSCVNICSPGTSNFIVKFQGAHHKDSMMLNTSIDRKVIDDMEHNQGVQALASIIQDSFFVSNDSLDSPVLMKINGNDHQGKLYVDALIANPSINENESRLSSISNAKEDSVIFIEEIKEVRMTDEFVQSPLPFKCSQGCSKMLNTANELKDHLKKDHELDPYLCSVLNCNASFKDAHLWRRHIETHKIKKYQCMKCTELFDSKWDFDEHSKGCNGLIDICEHEINNMLCRICASEATNNKNRQKNKSQKISNKKPKAKCKQPKSSARIASRTNVRLTHYNFQCTFGNCDSKFVQRGRLINHINVKHFGLVKKASERNENVDLRDPCIYIREISLNEKD